MTLLAYQDRIASLVRQRRANEHPDPNKPLRKCQRCPTLSPGGIYCAACVERELVELRKEAN